MKNFILGASILISFLVGVSTFVLAASSKVSPRALSAISKLGDNKSIRVYVLCQNIKAPAFKATVESISSYGITVLGTNYFQNLEWGTLAISVNKHTPLNQILKLQTVSNIVMPDDLAQRGP